MLVVHDSVTVHVVVEVTIPVPIVIDTIADQVPVHVGGG